MGKKKEKLQRHTLVYWKLFCIRNYVSKTLFMSSKKNDTKVHDYKTSSIFIGCRNVNNFMLGIYFKLEFFLDLL
jgi:hypothetical protein